MSQKEKLTFTNSGIMIQQSHQIWSEEDEKTKKEIIAFLKYYHTGQGNCVIYDNDWITWLEKLNKQKS